MHYIYIYIYIYLFIYFIYIFIAQMNDFVSNIVYKCIRRAFLYLVILSICFQIALVHNPYTAEFLNIIDLTLKQLANVIS